MAILPPATVLVMLGAAAVIGSLPLLLGLVKPNRFYGIRHPAAFKSAQNWYAINRFGALRFIFFGAIILTAGLILDHYPQLPFWVPILCLVGTLPLLLLTVRSIARYAQTL